jgi:hypothetical protein
MTEATLTFADLERVYERLATTLDALPEAQERLFLAQLALALAHRVGDVERAMTAIEEARRGVEEVGSG